MRSPQVRTVHVDPDSDVSEGPRYSIMHTHQTEAHTNIHTDAMESSSNTIGAASPYTVLHRPSFPDTAPPESLTYLGHSENILRNHIVLRHSGIVLP